MSALILAAFLLAGCATPRTPQALQNFDPRRDTLAFANELRWTYTFDAEGHPNTHESDPPPAYSLRCFPMVRATREFFYHARFEPAEPRTDDAEYERLVHLVISRNSRHPSPPEQRIVIPGFAGLHDFSAAFPEILQAHCGGALRSFLQRGNWRMVFPVTRSQQANVAARFVQELEDGKLPAAHVYRFPNTALNHALLIYGQEEDGGMIRFHAYDPNDPAHPLELKFDKHRRTFLLDRNRYFGGGPVKVYEVYRGILY